MVTIKTKQKQKTTSVSKKIGKLEPCALLLRMPDGAATVENIIAVPQKINIELPYNIGIPFLGI